jgi:PAS domain-containing protein
VPYFICPNCKQRSIDIDGAEGFLEQAVACHHCGFGFLFELMDDYYPAPATGLVVCDREGRILAVGRGVFELTGWKESDLLGADVVAGLGLGGFEDDRNPAKLALEWGVRRLDENRRSRRAAATGSRSRVTSSLPTTTTAACWSH